MKTLAWISALLLLSQPSTLNSQPSSANRVFDLDGNGSYVELPPNMFHERHEATLETGHRDD